MAWDISAQQAIELRVVSPVDGGFISDQVMLEARIEPQERRSEVVEVTFFADGKLVCRSTNVQLPRCAWNAGSGIRPHVVRVVATLASGEHVAAISRTRAIDHAETVDVQVVQVNASVMDRRGVFVRGLTREQFILREDDNPQTITHFSNEEAQLELVVAMDVSGSMGMAIEDLKVAVKHFLRGLAPKDQVTLVAFNEDMFVLTQRESSPAARERAVDRLGAWGGTALYDVIIRSIALLSRQPGRRGLVIFSDGDDRSSQATLDAVEQAVKTSDATLFTVALGRSRERSDLMDTLESLAEPSGGRVVAAERSTELSGAFAEILQGLKQQYLIGFESTNKKRDGEWRRLVVEIPGQRYRVRARQGYFGPK
jgi:Ca-activated chloride channel family protein